jgi:hypothetical protein
VLCESGIVEGFLVLFGNQKNADFASVETPPATKPCDFKHPP